jgi:hypothetical protein
MEQVEIHLVLFASQPDIQFACDSSWSVPAWNKKEKPTLPNGCYWADDGRAYTFEKESTTCAECLRTASSTA